MLLFLFKESPVNPKKNHHIQLVVLFMFCLITSATYGHLYSLFCWFRSAVWAKLTKKINQVQKYSIRTNRKNTHKTFASRWVPGSFIYQARHERKEKFKETTTAQSVFKVCFPQSTVRNSLLGIWEHLINSAWERGWRWEMEITKKKKRRKLHFTFKKIQYFR